jgi:hypothetical protein
MVKDPEVTDFKDIEPTENYVIEQEDFFLDGPISRRVAVLDFDPVTGKLTPGARFLPPDGRNKEGRYDLPSDPHLQDPAFMQVATFGGVYKTIGMFEETDTLGRRVRWAFPNSQLLVVPRAGEWANAFYERDSRSLQLFFFTPAGKTKPIYACHSQDIIAHETAHAVIDGVAPDLYHSTQPESLAIHESLADLATLIMAFRSRQLAAHVLEHTHGSIEEPSVFTAIAEQFGSALGKKGHSLRNINNDRKLTDPTLDRSEPHALSEVLSGALYAIMVKIYDELRGVPDEEQTPGESSVAVDAEYRQWAQSSEPGARQARLGDRRGTAPKRALFIASERFKRTILRALDYLPPGEVSFSDFGRALLASDQASHPDSGEQRVWLRQEFVRRGIAPKTGDLEVQTNFEQSDVTRLDLDELLQSDWLAYRFANRNRDWLGIPPRVPFEVRPRLDVTKRYYHRGDEPQSVHECLFKVSWTDTEENPVGGGLPSKRRFLRGTTLAIDWESKRVRAVVTGRRTRSASEARTRFLTRLVQKDALNIEEGASVRSVSPMRHAVNGEVINGVLRLRGTAHALHLWKEY